MIKYSKVNEMAARKTMLIPTIEGIQELEVIEYFEAHGRKLALHGLPKVSLYWVSDYATGMAFFKDDSPTPEAAKGRAIMMLMANPDYDFSQYKIINT